MNLQQLDDKITYYCTNLCTLEEPEQRRVKTILTITKYLLDLTQVNNNITDFELFHNTKGKFQCIIFYTNDVSIYMEVKRDISIYIKLHKRNNEMITKTIHSNYDTMLQRESELNLFLNIFSNIVKEFFDHKETI